MEYQATTFGERFAEIYDSGPEREDTPASVAFLASHAGDGPALELAVGTGRVALPLAAGGLRVDGVEISPEMVAKLRAKPGGDQIAVTIGDIAEVPVEGLYRLVFLVFNTLFNLPTQDQQVRCFENVAAHLTDDGVVQRYAWPSEIDLMARLAGLRLKSRWSGWRDEPFTSTSTSHVSV